jgi:hypothetical protein
MGSRSLWAVVAVFCLLLQLRTAPDAMAAGSEPHKECWLARVFADYNSGYVFAVTRELQAAVDSPAKIACLSPVTIVADLALLPFELTLGFVPTA